MRGVFLTYMTVWLASMSAFYMTITGCSQQPDEAAPAATRPPPPRPPQAIPSPSTHFIEPSGGDWISAAAKAGTASGDDLDRLAAPPHRPRAGRAVAERDNPRSAAVRQANSRH
jgi:hypothetical protein